MSSAPLLDRYGRRHTNLRVSVTDRCNIRCFYCMPVENVPFRPREELLSFEEIARFVRVAASLGINKVRLTGGEPLMRQDLHRLVRMLVDVPGIDDLALTTNGMLLSDQARSLRDAGLHRLNISLDTLDEETFQRITRRTGLDRVLAGIAAARRAGFDHIRLNAVSLRGITENEVVPLGRFAREHGLELRFIEFMPLDAERHWDSTQVLTGREVMRLLTAEFGPLTPLPRDDPSQPAVDYRYADGGGRVGFINPVSEPFCGDCNRLRLTAEGQVRNCLFSHEEWDARAILRNATAVDQRVLANTDIDAQLAALIRECVGDKKPGHGIDREDFLRPTRAMYQIGG